MLHSLLGPSGIVQLILISVVHLIGNFSLLHAPCYFHVITLRGNFPLRCLLLSKMGMLHRLHFFSLHQHE
jgi:hypothetical protein